MPPEEVKYFGIKASGGENLPVNLHYYVCKNEVYVSPSGRLCGLKSASIADRQTAEKFCEALTVKFQKKYGPSFSLEVHDVTVFTSRSDKEREKIKNDTAIVRNWLAKQ